MAKRLLWLLLVSSLFVCIYTQAPVFTVHPVSINTTESTVETFTCTANNSPTTLSFLVGGSGVPSGKGFNEFPQGQTQPNGEVSRTLEVTASVADNDNSMISCQAVGQVMGGSAPVTISNAAILRVQGRLSSVVDLTYLIDSSTISWSPPFTLPGTDITGYNVSATASDGSTANYFTSNSYYELSLIDITDSPCTEVNVTVSGYNGLDGEIDFVIVPPPELSVSVELYVLGNRTLMVQVNSTGGCLPEFSLALTLSIVSVTINSITISGSSSSIITYDGFTVSEDTIYTINVSYPIFNGDYTVTGTATIDTYGVGSVSCTSTAGTVMCTCYFHSFSTDTICTVQLVQNGVVEYTGTFNRGISNNMAEGTISGVVSGVYSILAYDEGISDVVSASQEDVTIMGIEPSTTTTTTTSTTTTSSTTPNTTTSTTTTTTTTTTTSSRSSGGGGSGSSFSEGPLVYVIPVVVVVIAILVVITVVLIIIFCCCNKKGNKQFSGDRKESSDGLIGSTSFTDRSPTNPPPNMEDMYSRPNMEAKTANAPIVYAELSGFNKPKNNTSDQPGNQTKKDDGKVVYSDLLIKGQPPPPPYEQTEIRNTRLHSSATVIPPRDQPTKLLVEHPDEDIQEIFFLHNNDDFSDDDTGKSPVTNSGSYPPPPLGRAPSPPEDQDFPKPPPIPSRHHGNNQLPDVVRHNQNRQDIEEGYTDESMNPGMLELTSKNSKQDESQGGGYLNTPTATYL